MLIREVNAGRLADGARLPPEREMAAELNVAVGTLRRALERLTALGLLERVQGSGNYIRQKTDTESVYAFFRLEKLEGGGLPTAQVLSADVLARPVDLGTEGHAEDVLRVRRVRALDGTAVALEEIWLDVTGADSIKEDDLGESLYLTYQRLLGLGVDQTEDRIGVASIPDWGADVLELAAGSPCGHVRRRGWAGGLGIIEVSDTWFDSNRATYVSRNK